MKRPRINNEIRVDTLRIIDENGKNLGVFPIVEAVQMAKEKGLDLIEVSPKANPPIAKIMDFGKFLYKEKKKEKDANKRGQEQEIKNIRIHLGTSEHDLLLKAKKADEFLREGSRLRVELFLKGREKYLDRDFLNERFRRIFHLMVEDFKILQEAKKSPRGIFVVIEKTR